MIVGSAVCLSLIRVVIVLIVIFDLELSSGEYLNDPIIQITT